MWCKCPCLCCPRVPAHCTTSCRSGVAPVSIRQQVYQYNHQCGTLHVPFDNPGCSPVALAEIEAAGRTFPALTQVGGGGGRGHASAAGRGRGGPAFAGCPKGWLLAVCQLWHAAIPCCVGQWTLLWHVWCPTRCQFKLHQLMSALMYWCCKRKQQPQ